MHSLPLRKLDKPIRKKIDTLRRVKSLNSMPGMVFMIKDTKMKLYLSYKIQMF